MTNYNGTNNRNIEKTAETEFNIVTKKIRNLVCSLETPTCIVFTRFHQTIFIIKLERQNT